jgi:hypothetical protein
MGKSWKGVRKNIKSVSESEKVDIAQQADKHAIEEPICLKDKIIIKIIDPEKTQEIDVSEGFTLLYTPDGRDVIEHGRIRSMEDRAAFAATALVNLSEPEYQGVISFVEEQRQLDKETPKSKFTAIMGGKTQ